MMSLLAYWKGKQKYRDARRLIAIKSFLQRHREKNSDTVLHNVEKDIGRKIIY
jgi:hypothetical protein